MSEPTYTDPSCPPVGTDLRYERGDGLLVSLRIDFPPPGGRPLAPPAKLTANPQLETRGPDRSLAVATRPGGPARLTDTAIYDHHDVGGRFTVCLLLTEGEEPQARHSQALAAAATTVQQARVDLRIGKIGPGSADETHAEIKQHGLSPTAEYWFPPGTSKYVAMRRMFRDPSLPVTTKWVVWLNDRVNFGRDAHWLLALADHIARFHRRENAHVFGATMQQTVNPQQRQVVQSRSWHKGRAWRGRNGKPSPTGTVSLFPHTGCWAVSAECLNATALPDVELAEMPGFGDWVIGEQVYQAGYAMHQFNAQGQFVGLHPQTQPVTGLPPGVVIPTRVPR